MKKRKIKWFEKKFSLRESMKKGLQYSFNSKEDFQCSQFFFCKDYLQDCIYSVLNQIDIKVYGFNYDPKINPLINLEKTSILISNENNKKLKEDIVKIVDFVNSLEDILGLKKSNIFLCNKNKNFKNDVYLIEGENYWLKSPPLISLYALMLRLGDSHKIGDDFWKSFENIKNCRVDISLDIDRNRLIDSEDGIKRIIKDSNIFYKDIKDNYKIDYKLKNIHNYYGIVCFSKISLKQPEYWFRNLK